MKEEVRMISTTHKPQRIRYAIKVRRLTVSHIEDLSASLRAITFSADDLQDFQSDGFDDHITVFFPHADGQLVLPQIGEKGVSFPEGAIKPAVREYTPTGIDIANNRLRLEFAIHDAGPATTWAKQVKIGEQIGIAGPRSALVLPMDAKDYVLIGDETALPAIRRRLSQLPAGVTAHVFAEIDSEVDQVPLPSAAQVKVVWAYRRGAEATSAHFLLQEVQKATLPKTDVQVWMGCEREQVRALREWFCENGWDKEDVKHASYWNKGVAAYHEPHD